MWLGAQAAGLGLSGEVSTEALELLLSGRDPLTGTMLGYPLLDRTLANGKVIRAVPGLMRRCRHRSRCRCGGR